MTGLAGARILGRLGITVTIALLLYLGVYRPLQLRWGASPGEVARPMPGDEIQPRPIFDATRAISIDAPPERIWPWLVQIGYRRAGWYSGLDWLDNDGVPSADHILPGLQHLAAGDELPVWRDITHRVVAVEPGRYLLAASASGQDSWLWALVPEGTGRTRLVWRMRHAAYEWTSPGFLVLQLATDLGDFVVVRNILLGVKERAEGRPVGLLAVETPEVLSWLLAFAAFLAALFALVVRRDWRRPLAAIAATSVTTLLLVFAMPPLWVDVLVVVVIYVFLWWLHRTSDSAPVGSVHHAAAPVR